MKHLITLKDWSIGETRDLLGLAQDIKFQPTKYNSKLHQKTLIMLFEKTSTRTRLSFETAMTQLGGHAIFLDRRTTQFMLAEFIDEIRAVMKYGDALMYRPLHHESLLQARDVATIPIINALCDKYHPCQALGDALTMIEYAGGNVFSLKGKKVVWLGKKNNVCNSLIEVCRKLGATTTIIQDEKDLPLIKDADFIHTDTWIDMEYFDDDGQVNYLCKDQFKKEAKKNKPLQLNKKLLDKYNCKAKIMHCMPCHVGYEISRDAIDHPNSIIFEQAENRLHVQKALLLKMIE